MPARSRRTSTNRTSADTWKASRPSGLLRDDAELPADARAGLECPREVSLGVGGHAARPEERSSSRRGRGYDRIYEDAFLLKPPRHPKRAVVVADDDGDDWRLGLARVKAEARQPIHQETRVAPELLPALGLVHHDVDRGGRGGDRCRRERGREDQAPSGVTNMVDDRSLTRDEAADRSQRLGERPHHEVHIVLEIEVLGGAPAAPAEHSEPVRVVDHD